MIVRRLLLNLVIVMLSGATSFAQPTGPSRVAVLPFEIYSNLRSAGLQKMIAEDLSRHIAGEGQLTVVDHSTIATLMEKSTPTFSKSALSDIAEKLEADFLVLGSVTKIGENVSLDTYLFNPHATPPFSKSFAEGKNLEALLKEMGAKISDQVVKSVLSSQKTPEAGENVASEAPGGTRPGGSAVEKPREVPEEPAGDREAAEGPVVAYAETGSGEDGVQPPASLKEEEPGEMVAEEGGQEAPPVAADGKSGEAGAVRSEAPLKEEAPATVALLKEPDREGTARRKKKSGDKPFSSPFSTLKPVKITSKTMEADNKRNMVTFKGNVVVKQEDIVIFSDTMKVSYEPKGGINRVEASGNVKMSQENRVATGRKLVFYNPEQKIVMTGSPKIWQGDNLISCEKVTVLLEDNKIVFEGKVDSIIYPRSLKGEKDSGEKQVEEITPPRLKGNRRVKPSYNRLLTPRKK